MEDWKGVKKHFSKIGFLFVFGTVLIFAVQFAAIGLMEAIRPEVYENADLSLLVTSLPMYLIAMPVLIWRLRKVPGVTLPKHSMKTGQLLAVFCITYAVMWLGNMLGTILAMLIGLLKGGMVSNMMADMVQLLNPATAFFLMVICAPLFEEFIFRKLLIDKTVRYGESTAVLLSGLMFGLFHGNLNQFAYAFPLGLFWGFIYVKTGKLIYTIVSHMLINFMGSVLSMLLLRSPVFQADFTDMYSVMQLLSENTAAVILYTLYGVFILGLVIAGSVLFLLNRKKFRCCPGETVIPKGKRFSVVILNAGMVSYILIWLVQIVLQLFA